jgi:hypothetical protein
MLPAIAAMLIAQGIGVGTKLVKAGVQAHKANKLAKTPRPQYEIPEAVKQQVNQARYIAGMRELPGQNLIESKIGQNVGKGVAELKNVSANPADMASNVAKMYSGANDAIGNVGIQAGNQWLQNQGMLNQNLGMLGQYQNQQFDINKMQPYRNDMAASAALREGAYRNLSAAGQDVASAGAGYANMMFQQDQLNTLMGNKDGIGGEASSQMIGNFQPAPRQQTLTEASQTPMISEGFTQDPEGAVPANSKNKMVNFLIGQMLNPNN